MSFEKFDKKEHELPPKFNIEVPENRSYGDLAANAAMAWTKSLKMPPKKVAEQIISELRFDKICVKKCEIAGPGFINFYLFEDFYIEVLKEILEKKENYGKNNFGQNKRVLVEFVSANPTGPMHLGNARGGAMGDCLASVLDFSGFEVKKEFYVNDAGGQIEKFADSLEARYLQHFLGEKEIEFPEDGYKGEDITALSSEFIKKYEDKFLKSKKQERTKALVKFSLPKNIKKMELDLKKYKITYDNWFFESSLYKNGEIKEVLNELKKKGVTYKKDGVVWAKAEKIGCDKDKVLVRKNSVPTYFAADIAYHRNKFLRGFDLCIDIWGADHHGHVQRMKGAMKALGFEAQTLEIVLVQFVRLVRNKKIVRMSKRTGKAIGLVDLLEEVNIDEARFLFNMLRANTQMDFDLEIASKKSYDNPLYYVQYAHARICSILDRNKKILKKIYKTKNKTLNLLKEESEKDLIFLLSCFTSELIESSKVLNPTSITKYAVKIANLFHKFYNLCKIETEDLELRMARVCLCLATKTVIKNILDMFKVTAPENM